MEDHRKTQIIASMTEPHTYFRMQHFLSFCCFIKKVHPHWRTLLRTRPLVLTVSDDFSEERNRFLDHNSEHASIIDLVNSQGQGSRESLTNQPPTLRSLMVARARTNRCFLSSPPCLRRWSNELLLVEVPLLPLALRLRGRTRNSTSSLSGRCQMSRQRTLV